MAKRTKSQQAEREESIRQLREWIKPGDTVYTILDHVSSSGMSRAIRVLVPSRRVLTDEDCANRREGAVDFIHPNYAVGKVLDLRHWKRNGREQDALVVGGCGMDMGFHLVYELSHTLYGGRLVPDIYLDHATHDEPGGQLLTRTGAPSGSVYLGGYACLGKGKCPSNYHSNHRDYIRCDGIADRHCYRPDAFGRWPVPEDWPRGTPHDIGEGHTIAGPLLACLAGSGENGKPYEVCPTCQGAGSLPNPEGPERFDLVHTDGYALRHKWL